MVKARLEQGAQEQAVLGPAAALEAQVTQAPQVAQPPIQAPMGAAVVALAVVLIQWAALAAQSASFGPVLQGSFHRLTLKTFEI